MQDFNYFTEKKLECLEIANSYLGEGDKENYYLNKRESLRYELMEYQSIGCKEARIWTAGDRSVCRKCRRLQAKIFTVEEALNTMPIPIRNCPSRFGYCRCDYLPIANIIELG